MNFSFKVTGAKGQPLSIDVSVGLRTARDLRSLMLDAAYALKGNAGTFLALLFKCGFTPERLATELSEFNGVVQPEFADRVKVVAINHPQELGAALRGSVKADLLQELQDRIIEASTGGSPSSSSREAVQFLLLRRWLRGLPPIKTAELAAQSGASAPTVSAALKANNESDVLRTRDRKVALKGFSPQSWQKWLSKSAEAQTAKFVDRSGSPRSTEKLAKKLQALGRNDVAVGGVLGATHHYPAIDITGAPRLDILIQGTHHADLSFIEQLDPGLERDDSHEGNAHVVVHFTNRRENYFEVQNGVVWADVLDCLVHLWKAGLTHQVEDLINHLTRQVKQPEEQKWTTP
jgi:hypothetical protein